MLGYITSYHETNNGSVNKSRLGHNSHLQAVLNMVEKFKEIEFVEASVQERVHALESRLAQVETVVDRVFEWTHFHFPNQLFAHLGGARIKIL